MTSQQLSDLMGEVQSASFKGECHKCGKDTEVTIERISETELAISGGSLLASPESWELDGQVLCKCEACFQEKSDFGRPCEVYSRVVGYMRPIKSWNEGKQAEFKMRKNFKVIR